MTDTVVVLTLNSDGDTLSGTTDTLKIQCNYGVGVDLATTVDSENPEETTNALILISGESELSKNNDGYYALGNSSGVEKSFTLGLSAAQPDSSQRSRGRSPVLRC